VRAKLIEALTDYDKELTALPSNRARVQLSYFVTEVAKYNEWANLKRMREAEAERKKSGF
jgi:hypothetical protein